MSMITNRTDDVLCSLMWRTVASDELYVHIGKNAIHQKLVGLIGDHKLSAFCLIEMSLVIAMFAPCQIK